MDAVDRGFRREARRIRENNFASLLRSGASKRQKDQFCGDNREPRNGGRLMEDPQPEPIVPRHPISDSAYQIAVVLAVLLLLATVSLF
jgi:hypothetical protein